jgi:pyruvate,water dikinase
VTAFTAPLSGLRSADEGTFGGKSSALGELLAGGIPVPHGFGVSTGAYDAFLDSAGLRGELEALVAALDVDDVEAVAAVSATVVAAIREAAVPEQVRAEVHERYEALVAEAGDPALPVAVRSSALGEDSAEATFAGQQESYLWVRGAEGVCDAMRDCWASLHSPPSITYRARRGDTGREPAMGVTVQRMVDAETAGVMFTCSPVSGDPSVVAVNASWGLGLAVVGGDVTPDEYVINKVTGELVRSTVGDKTIEYRPDPEGRGTVRVDVAAERAQAPCLDAGALTALAGLAGVIERHFGAHQDIEWAIDREGRVAVLQTRPVTVVPKARGPAGGSALALVMATFGVEPRTESGS